MSLDDLLEIPQTKEYLSSNQLFDWFTCRQLYAYKHVEKREPDFRRSLKTARGSAGHRAVEFYLTKKMEQQTLSLGDLQDFYATVYDQEAADAEQTEDAGKFKDSGIRIVETLHTTVLPTINPVALEQKFEIDVYGIPYVGRLDIVTSDGVRDLKFSAKSPAANMADTSHQLSGYALAFQKMYGKPATEIGLDYVVSLQRKTKYVHLPTERTPAQLERFSSLIPRVKADIDSMIFYPNDSSWKCNDCPFRRTCKG